MNRCLLLIGLIFGLASCRSSKITEPVFTKAPKAQTLIDSVLNSQFEFEWLSAKISGKYKDAKQSFSFKGNMKIKKDSLIWMSISPGLGLELGRVLMDKDSIRFMNRFEKTDYKSSYHDLSVKVQSPLSFQRIQALLLGNPFDEFTAKKYYADVVNQLFTLSSLSAKQIKKVDRNRRKSNKEIYWAEINPMNSKILSQQYKNYYLNRTLAVEYQDFEFHETFDFAESIDLSILTDQEVSLSLSYSKIHLNKTQKFPFNVPKSYEIIR
jgi:hypothetical protein